MVGSFSARRWSLLVLGLSLALVFAGLPILATPGLAASAVGVPVVDAVDGDELDRPDAVSAMVTARASGNRVEDLSQRTETRQVFANPEGTWTSEAAAEPVRVQDAQGGWDDIDTTLVAVQGGFAPKHALGGLVVSNGGDRTFAALNVENRDLGWKWPTVLPAPLIEGPMATYADVVDGGDLVVTATSSGFRHDIVLHQAPADSVSFKIPVLTGGPELSESNDGELAITTQSGDELVSAPAPVMYDATRSEIGKPENVVPVDATVTDTASGGVLELKPDQAFLSDPETEYPVTIDPTYSSTPTADTWVYNSSPNAIHPYDEELLVGTYDSGGHRHRSFIQFGNGPWDNQSVSSASLILRNFDAATCDGYGVQVTRIAESWAAGSTTWNDQPTVSTTAAMTSNVAAGYSSSCPAADVAWNVTGIVQAWATGTANYGFRVAALTETSNKSWRVYHSANYQYATYKPKLSVTYSAPPMAAAIPSTNTGRTYDGSLYVGTDKPAWTSSATDPESSQVKLTTEVRPSTTSGTVSATCTTGLVASGSAATCTPTAALANNTTYVVRTRASDQGSAPGPWSPWRTIKTDLTTPTVPSLSCTGVADKHWYETRPASATTCTVSGNGADVEYQLNGQTKPALTPSTTFSEPIPTSGFTNVEVRSRTRAGAVSEWARVGFGTGPASLLSPIANDRSSSTFPVEAAAPGGAQSARVQWRFAPDTAGTPDPGAGWINATDVKGTNGITPWTGSVSGVDWSTTPKLVWDPQAETGISSTALVEVRVLFTYAGSVEKASPLQRVQVVPHAFGGSFPTDSAGPGEVALFTGEFQLSETDVSVPGYGGTLNLGRSHLSMAGTPSGPVGVFGPGWKADLSGPDEGIAGFTVTDRTAQDGSIVLASPEGDSYVYRHDSGTAGAQKAGTYKGVGETALDDDTLKLALVTGETGVSHRLTLTEWDGTKTIFVRANGIWTTEKVIGVEDASTTSYTHDGDGSVTWIFAPAPAAVNCNATSQQPGCRALHLNYTGTGSAKRLASVDLRIYNPHTASDGLPGAGAGMETITVAKYSYDGAGQLTAAWDPRIGDGSQALKTQYAYSPIDGAGHTRLTSMTEPGLKPWVFNYDGTDRLNTVTRSQDSAVGGTAATWTVRYDVALSGTGLPDMTAESTATWGQPALDAPTTGAAVFGPDKPSADDYEYASLSYWTKSGRLTNSASFGAGKWQVDSQRYDHRGNTIWSLDAAGRNQATAEGATPEETAGAASKYAAITVYNADGTRVQETYSPTHTFVLKDGTSFTGRTLTQTVYDGEPDAAGFSQGRPTTNIPDGGFNLPVREFTSATDKATPAAEGQRYDIEETRNRYDPIQSGDGDGWKLQTSTRVLTQNGSGWSMTSTRFDTEGKVIETRTPESNASTGTAATARTMTTVYYTPGTGADRAECRNKPQWAGEMCWHGTPASGAAIPATTTTGYSTLLAPTRTEETTGAATRTALTGFDAAGRVTREAVSTTGLGTADREVQPVTTAYSPTTGAATSLSNGAQTQTTEYDTWGRTTSQTDGVGNTATTSYDTADRISSANDGKGIYTYTYNGTDSLGKKERRGLATKLDVGLANGPDEFTGAYDDNGELIEQNYPGGVRATWTRDQAGAPISLTYSRAGIDLLAFTDTLDQTGRVRVATGSTSRQSYSYDDRDRLTKVEDTTDNTCTTRVYNFSDDSNRNTLTNYAPATAAGSEGNCQTTTPASTKTSTFDDADRITDVGYTYDPLGRTKGVPADDTTTALESRGNLAVSYHANDLVATLSQTGTQDGASLTKSQDFTLDAVSRISVIKNLTGAVSLEESTNHYDDNGDSPAWIDTKKRPNATTAWSSNWSRNISTLGGDLGIIQASDGPAEVHLANLHGDIVSTQEVGAASIDSYTKSDEYGIPRTAPPSNKRYGWLGAEQRQSDGIVGGLTLMGVRLYNPVSGRFLSRDPVEGGNDNTYTYPVDPINVTDLTGECPWCIPILVMALREAARQAAKRAAKAAAKRAAKAAVKRAKNACRVNSFDQDTPVLMADGTLKPISDVELGDLVWATDPETDEEGSREVTNLIRHGGRHRMVAVKLADGTTIDATDSHPFWVGDPSPPSKAGPVGTWADAMDLSVGDELLVANGRTVEVVRTSIYVKNLTAYNLTVAGLHTYHVGNEPVLVHNCAKKRPVSKAKKLMDRAKNRTKGGAEHTSNKSPSKRPRHEGGKRRQNRDQGGERADYRRPY